MLIKEMNNPAPIVLFAYNRPRHTQRTLDALAANTEAKESILFIYCDGVKEGATDEQQQAVKEVGQIALKERRFKDVIVKLREHNMGLAASVIEGVSEIVNKYGSIIVLEDDLVVSPGFLSFMNTSLEKYKMSGNVACISGYVYPLKKKFTKAFFIKGADCWGWATWSDRWNKLNTNAAELKSKIVSMKQEKEFSFNDSYPYMQMLEDKLAGKNQSWAILWYATSLVNKQLCLYPPHSLVHNIGNDGSGTHTAKATDHFTTDLKDKIEIIFPAEITESNEGRKEFENFFNSSRIPLISKVKSRLKGIYKRIFSNTPTHGWFGNYATWKEAQQKCTGYAAENILEKVKTSLLKVKNGEAAYERDSVLFDEVQYSEPLVQAFKMIAKKSNILNVIDFGGSLGSSFFQNKGFLGNLTELKWNIVEQKHFVDCGKKYFEDKELKFYYTIEEALKENEAKVLLLSSVIQYFEKPYELIRECLQYGFDYIIVDRTAFIENKPERITVQIVPEFIYKASYAAWFLSEPQFLSAFKDNYEMMNGFVSEQSKPIKIDQDTQVYWKGFVFKKIE